MPEQRLAMWTVYDRPRDYPDEFVARLSFTSGDGIAHTSTILRAPTLAELRELLPQGLTRLDRHPDDDPVIIEVWL